MGCALRQTHLTVYTALLPPDLVSARAFIVQSDLLWASLVKELYDKVEEQLGKEVVREHRASIALSDELPSDSPETKRQKRQCAMRQRRVAASLSTACGFISAIGLYFAFEQLLRVFICPAAPDAIDAFVEFCDCTSEGRNTSETAGGCLPPLLADAPMQLLGLLPAGFAALGPGSTTTRSSAASGRCGCA